MMDGLSPVNKPPSLPERARRGPKSVHNRLILIGMGVVALCLSQIFVSKDSLERHLRQGINVEEATKHLEHQVAVMGDMVQALNGSIHLALDQTSASVRSLSARDIVNKAFNKSFVHLTECPDDMDIRQCLTDTFSRSENRSEVPWWFQTMLQYAPVATSPWHTHLARNAENNGDLLKFCSIEKIGTKHWRKVFCMLQNKTSPPNGFCAPDHKVHESVPKAVFLRDPLERFLSAYMDKCVAKKNTRERHCEPDIVFLDDKNGLQKGLANNSRLSFEAYVESMPLKWNVHFFPQSLYCDGLFRHLPSYDFVGMMDQNFYYDVYRMGLRYGEHMMDTLETVFHLKQALNESKHNVGVEGSASTHVVEFYTPRSVRRVLEYMAIDYVMLNIPIPAWVDEILQQEDVDG